MIIAASNINAELYHHGILGMKWGVRRYQNADGSYTAAGRTRYGIKAERAASKISTSKTGVGKNFNNHRAYRNERIDNTITALGKDATKRGVKGAVKRVDDLYGHGRQAATQKAASNYYNRKADYSKTNLGKTINKSNAYNMESWAKQNEKLHNSNSASEYAKNFVDAMVSTPIKTWSGREITTGKRYVETALNGMTLGLYGTVKDVSYYNSTKPTKESKKHPLNSGKRITSTSNSKYSYDESKKSNPQQHKSDVNTIGSDYYDKQHTPIGKGTTKKVGGVTFHKPEYASKQDMETYITNKYGSDAMKYVKEYNKKH